MADAWHICPGFITPLVQRLEQWQQKPKEHLDDLDDLIDIEGFLHGMGYSDEVSAFDRAMAWLHVRRLDHIGRSIRARIRNMCQRARALEGRLEVPTSTAAADSWRSQFSLFEHSVVEKFLRYLRNLGIELEEQFPFHALSVGTSAPGKHETVAASGSSGSSRTDEVEARPQAVKPPSRRRGRPPKKTTKKWAQFARPRIEKGMNWSEIFHEYHEQFPRDKEASADTIRQAYHRTCPAR